MRKILLCAWLAVPVGTWAYHEGPGQDRMALDDAADRLRDAYAFAQKERWLDTVEAYEAALQRLPADRTAEARRIRLELNKARMMAAGLPVARADLEQLVRELADDPHADQALLADARAALANSQYYMTWLMRLEGMPRDEWEPEIEASRQTYRLLAELAQARGDSAAAEQMQKDLESSVRLARMELKDLQGLPLPSQ
jgi:hypothetical protein